MDAPEQDSPVNEAGSVDVGEDEDLALLEGDSDNEDAVEPGLPSNALDDQLEVDQEDYRATGLMDEEDEEISTETGKKKTTLNIPVPILSLF